MTKLFWIFWPSFLVAAAGEILFFAVVDPRDMYVFGEPANLSPLAVYSIGFLCLWALCAASSLATRHFQRRGEEINREAGGHHPARHGDTHFA